MILIHRHRAEATLEQMACPAPACADEGGIPPVRLADRPGEAGLVRGGQDEMNMVRHQAIGPTGDAVALQAPPHQIQIDRLIAGFEEYALPPIAALGDVMRRARDDHPRPPRHPLHPSRR
jgi:hypothetical protein